MALTDEIAPPVPASGWRLKFGLCIVCLALLLWVSVPISAAMGVSAGRITALTGFIFIVNKVLLLACVAVMGKAGFQQLKAMIFGYAKGLTPSEYIGPTRHAVGLVMFCLPLLSAMVEPYVDSVAPGLRPNLWQLQLLGDIMFIASFFVLGGNFWAKLRALFVRSQAESQPVTPSRT